MEANTRGASGVSLNLGADHMRGFSLWKLITLFTYDAYIFYVHYTSIRFLKGKKKKTWHLILIPLYHELTTHQQEE